MHENLAKLLALTDHLINFGQMLLIVNMFNPDIDICEEIQTFL